MLAHGYSELYLIPSLMQIWDGSSTSLSKSGANWDIVWCSSRCSEEGWTMNMVSLSPPRVWNMWHGINLHLGTCSPENLMNSSLYPVEVGQQGQQVYHVSSWIRQLCVLPENLPSTSLREWLSRAALTLWLVLFKDLYGSRESLKTARYMLKNRPTAVSTTKSAQV